jgi:hypothetical protein
VPVRGVAPDSSSRDASPGCGQRDEVNADDQCEPPRCRATTRFSAPPDALPASLERRLPGFDCGMPLRDCDRMNTRSDTEGLPDEFAPKRLLRRFALIVARAS